MTTVAGSWLSMAEIEIGVLQRQWITSSAGVNNLADKKPPFIGTLELRTDAATYDVIGRMWYLAAKVKL